MLKKLNKGILKFSLKINKSNFGFLSTSKPWSHQQDADELPAKGSEFDYRMETKRTYTKWFNPMTFDPRTPDYFETVRSEWQEDVTREDFGERKKII
jgi:hypothetical protein